MSRVVGLVQLMRPPNSLMVGFAVLVGVAVTSPAQMTSLPALLGFVTGFTISSFAMVVNDYLDAEVDRINMPHRPIPSGRVKPSAALAFALILLGIGLTASIFTSPINLIIAASFAALSWAYSSWGKRYGLIGNHMVALSVAIPLVYGGVAVGGIIDPLIWLLFLTSLLAAAGREVVKTIIDVKGDEVRYVRSVARVWGERSTGRLAGALFLAAVATSWIPLVLGIVGLSYALAIIPAVGIFTYISAKVWRDWSHKSAIKVKSLALLGMMLGLIAFVTGGALKG